MSSQPATVGEYLKTARTRHGYSIRHVAALAGLNHSTVKRIEDGDCIPTPDALLALADALNVSVTVLVRFIPVYDNLIRAGLPNLTEYLGIKYTMKREDITEITRHARRLGYDPTPDKEPEK